MKISPIQLLYFSLIALAASLFIHILTVLKIYLVPISVVYILIIGVIISWLQSRSFLKDLSEENETQHPWTLVFDVCPAWYKYLTYFLFIYALINFGFAVSAPSDDVQQFVNFDPAQPKMRIITGFFLAFYAYSAVIARATMILKDKQDEKNI